MDIDNTDNRDSGADRIMSNENHTANILVRIGRIITFIAAGFLLVILISEGTVQGVATSDISGILLVILAVIALAGYAISLWRIKYAGILLVLVAIAFGIHTGYYISANQFFAWVMMGLPHLIAGGLFLLGWQMKKKPDTFNPFLNL
jgi:hypothetical protein